MMSAFFHFQHTLNRFFSICVKLHWYEIIKLTLHKKTALKRSILIRVKNFPKLNKEFPKTNSAVASSRKCCYHGNFRTGVFLSVLGNLKTHLFFLTPTDESLKILLSAIRIPYFLWLICSKCIHFFQSNPKRELNILASLRHQNCIWLLCLSTYMYIISFE